MFDDHSGAAGNDPDDGLAAAFASDDDAVWRMLEHSQDLARELRAILEQASAALTRVLFHGTAGVPAIPWNRTP